MGEVAFPKENQEPEEGVTDAGEQAYEVLNSPMLVSLVAHRGCICGDPLVWRTQPSFSPTAGSKPASPEKEYFQRMEVEGARVPPARHPEVSLL